MKKQLKGGGVIGITGFARTGKDTLCQALLARANDRSERVALADELKKEMAPVVRRFFNRDILTLNGPEKELIRPLIVEWAEIRRHDSKGTHWTRLVTPKVKKIIKNGGWAIISDLRFADPRYPNDEVNWLQDMGGRLIHLKRYKLAPKRVKNSTKFKFEREYSPAPNKTEEKNNKILLDKANYKIEWPDVGDSLSKLDRYVEELVDYLNENNRGRG